ncbi:alpha/beta hydrolase family protein [Flavilitoribacter nigricans]|uniref:Acetylxylan esterase n=1 Tax=Flavilitoribacter nigricans (strain ATCC 23147 / DSM 23189 / NBRC 102662 / NCIMB 1420 / SS-2) TaxID=1122177 RepID=A0A2D0MWX3_FLAN2|nr:CocE/NonD family hydrolase [Flavilitoribacter nigricans]PHN00680.1 acetylxylan esterase [Flavilitoribacter nigricans DSM 23189 = NBRC 102662]
MKYLLASLLTFWILSPVNTDPPVWDFDTQLNDYFAAETERIKLRTEQELSAIEDWETYKTEARRELQDMLGLWPMPEKTPLEATVTESIEHEEFTVQNLHFQSMPGLYVTGNLYIPKNLKEKVPAIIYVCGHANVKKDGYSYGAKVNYQHHPAWFARNGYVCLILDTVQLGEIEGIHHGLHRYQRWWWQSRGYTPAGVETWNGIRAIDYLLTRPEVDPERIGITGRSGGGVTSWWVGAMDERIKVAVPVAGITDMEDHVVNGCVEDHCDCMYMYNTYQWDFPKVAALLAPRPLLISNTDRDIMFPVEGVFRVYRQVRQIYEQLGAGDQLALNITAGPHRDEQELRVHAFRWFNRYFYQREGLIEKTAVKFFEPEQLRVFKALPGDERNTRIDESFNTVAPSTDAVLAETSPAEARSGWRKDLDRIFANWPENDAPAIMDIESRVQSRGMQLTTYRLPSDEHTNLPVFHLQSTGRSRQGPTRIILLDEDNWADWSARLAGAFPGGPFWSSTEAKTDAAAILQRELTGGSLLLISMRGAGPAAFSGDEFKQAQIRKRYYLLGQSLQAMQTWDIRRALEAFLQTSETKDLTIEAEGISAGMALYASLFLDNRISLELTKLPASHLEGPYYPKVLRYMDMPAALMLAREKHAIRELD